MTALMAQLSPRSRKRGIYALYIISLLDLTAVSLFLPLITREIKNLGASTFMVGVVGSVYGAIQLFSSPIVGRESDKYGRKTVISVTLAATALAYVLQGSATSLSVFLVARCIAGMFKHTQTIGKAVAADLAPLEKSYVFGNMNAFGNMGYIVGPTIGGHLVSYENGFQHVCLLAATIFVLNILMLVMFVPETVSRKDSKDTPLLGHKTDKKDHPKGNKCFDVDIGSMSKSAMAAVLIIRFLFSFATLAPRANLALVFDNKFQASVVSQGYLTSAQATVATMTGFLVGPITAKLYNEQHRKMVMHAGTVHMIAMLGLFIAPTFSLAGLSLMFVSGVNPFQRVGIAALSLAGTADPGAILGLGQTATSLARMLAPALAGLAQTYSDDGPALLGVISAALALLFTYYIVPRDGDQGKKASTYKTEIM